MNELIDKVTIQAGYTDRLKFLMKLAGHREHGTLTTLTRYSLMSRTGVLKMIEADRPPAKQESFEHLLKSISDDFWRIKKTKVAKDALSKYLLFGLDLPSNLIALIPGFVEEGLNEKALTFVYAVAKKNSVDLNQITNANKQKVQARIAHYCSKNNIDELSPKLESIVSSLLILALEDELI